MFTEQTPTRTHTRLLAHRHTRCPRHNRHATNTVRHTRCFEVFRFRWDFLFLLERHRERGTLTSCVCIWFGQNAKLRDASAEWRMSCASRTEKYGKISKWPCKNSRDGWIMRREKARWRGMTHVQWTFSGPLSHACIWTRMKMCEVRSECAVRRKMCVRQVSVCSQADRQTDTKIHTPTPTCTSTHQHKYTHDLWKNERTRSKTFGFVLNINTKHSFSLVHVMLGGLNEKRLNWHFAQAWKSFGAHGDFCSHCDCKSQCCPCGSTTLIMTSERMVLARNLLIVSFPLVHYFWTLRSLLGCMRRCCKLKWADSRCVGSRCAGWCDVGSVM